MKKLSGIIFFIIIVSALTAGIIFYARGYRPDFENGSIKPTGVVSIKSQPDGAVVFIDGEEKGTTNIDIPNLQPGKYAVKIVKEGFSSWERTVEVKKENVNLIEALLFPTAPSLRALTFTGAIDPLAAPNGKLIAFSVIGGDEKSGIWVLNISSGTLPSFFARDLTRLVVDSEELKFSRSAYEFSPDSTQLLVRLYQSDRYFLLAVTEKNDPPKDVTLDIAKIKESWSNQKIGEKETILKAFGEKAALLADSLTNLKFSPDKTKFIGRKNNGVGVLYNSDPGPAPNQEPEIYNLPKGTNFLWYPDNEHVVIVKTDSISVIDADGKNNVTIYTGDFDPDFVVPWSDGSRIVVSTNLNSAINKISNLYAIELF
ncbi:PEGA domain-containing protein [Patescibacteria group bacterium]|nr:PEGA domain-containing protein [Patescibacteria group bacterium]